MVVAIAQIGNMKLIVLNAIALRKNYMQIKIYTITGCKTCLSVKKYFDKINIEYEEIDCDKNLDEAIAIMKLAGSNELPVIRYGKNNFIIGYNEDNLNKFSKLCKN